jgi:hypothetical protein
MKFLGITDEFQGLLVKRRSEPMPSLLTFAPGILPFTQSTETSLRHPGCARFPTLLDWHRPAPHPLNSEKNQFSV